MYKGITNIVNIHFTKIESIFSWGAALFAVFAIVRSIQISNYINAILGFSILFCMLMFFYVKNNTISQNPTFSYSKSLRKINHISFVILYVLATFSLYFYQIPYERPLTFFVFYFLMIGSVLLQILYDNEASPILLFKIVFLVLFYILTQALLFKSLMSIDSYTHMGWTNIIVNTGEIPGFGPGYTFLFHFLHAEVQLIAGLDYNYSNLLFVLPSVMICTILTIFLIGRNLVSRQIGLLASLILICSTYFLNFSINLIPNSFSSVYLLFSLFILLKIDDIRKPKILMPVLLLFVILTAFTHLLTDAILLVILSTYVLYMYLVKRDNAEINKIGFTVVIFSIVTSLVVYIYMFRIFGSVTEFVIFGTDFYQTRAPDPLRGVSPFIRPVMELLHERISYFIFWIVSIPGYFYLIRKSNRIVKQSAFSYAALAFSAIFFLILATGREFINIRFFYLVSFVACIFAAIFIILTFQTMKDTYRKGIIVVMTLSICIVCTISLPANITNSLYPSVSGPQVYPSESELSMVSSLRTLGTKPLASDEGFNYTEGQLGRPDIAPIDASIKYLDFLHERSYTIILRDSIFKFTPGKEIFYPEKDVVIYSLATNHFSKIFDVGRARSFEYS